MNTFVKIMDSIANKIYNNPIERFLTNLIDRIHDKLGFWRSAYMLIGIFMIVLGALVTKNMDKSNSDFLIVFMIFVVFGAFFIGMGRFVKDKQDEKN